MSKGVTALVEEIGQYVFVLFRDKLPENLVYHDFLHTYDTVVAARKIARSTSLSQEEIETLLIAGISPRYRLPQYLSGT